MDWYLERADQLGELRHELVAYLARHAAPGSQAGIDDAELVFSEAVGNALRHTGGPVWVSLTWSAEMPALLVYDVGNGFDLAQQAGLSPDPSRAQSFPGPEDDSEVVLESLMEESGRGLMLIRALAPHVSAALRASAGVVVSVTLPVRRATTTSHDPPRRHAASLPSMHEARPEGAFGKEAFLRALVVEMSRTVEAHHGPDAAEAVIAQVGTDVGGQMETEFRVATEVVGALTPEQLGECYVRLKHAIDGQFSVVEATRERIVLENRRCPFGEAVRHAPSLCRMTSSVFGGLAARNHPDGAAVLLEERIAVGDPGCRVVVYLGPPPAEVAPFAHRYRSPDG